MSILSPTLLGAVGLVLVTASLSHLRSPEALAAGLRAHNVLPGHLHGWVSRALGPVEAALGVGLLLVAGAGLPTGATLAVSMPTVLLFLILTGYLARVLRIADGRPVPCACGLGQIPVSRSAVLRAGILALFALLGAVTDGGWSLASAPVLEVAVAGAAVLVLALATALLPAARAVPEAVLAHGGTPRHTATAPAGARHHLAAQVGEGP